MLLDIFKADGFTLNSLTAAINNIPYTPTVLVESGLFTSAGVSTLDVSIESDGKTIGLVSVQPRNAPAQVVTGDKRTIRTIKVPHLPERSNIMADEVQGVRAFGSESQAQVIETVRDERLAKMKRQIEYTIEAHRLSAVMGSYYDAAGNVTSLFTEFGVSQQTINVALTTATTEIKTKCADIIEKVELALDGLSYIGINVYCGSTFWKELISHPKVEKFYLNWTAANTLNTDPRAPFPFMGLNFIRYRGTSAVKIADGEAYAVPTGVMDLFITRFAPANYIETVNTIGMPFYAKVEPLEMGKGIALEAQSNPLNLCTRPAAVIKLTDA
jgi:Phage major capsid protein E